MNNRIILIMRWAQKKLFNNHNDRWVVALFFSHTFIHMLNHAMIMSMVRTCFYSKLLLLPFPTTMIAPNDAPFNWLLLLLYEFMLCELVAFTLYIFIWWCQQEFPFLFSFLYMTLSSTSIQYRKIIQSFYYLYVSVLNKTKTKKRSKFIYLIYCFFH